MLRKCAEVVARPGSVELTLIEQMVKTMYANQGIGLAAPQVGVSKRIIVVDAGEGLLKMLNPRVVLKSGAAVAEEGCLSVPTQSAPVKRPVRISVTYINEVGKRLVDNFSGLTGRAIQHEIDHLDGKLIIDYLPWYKKVFPKKEKRNLF